MGDKTINTIAIVGGGVTGLAIGWQLAKRGCSVTVFERHQIGGGASWAAAGMLAAQAEAEPGEESLHRLLLAGQQIWPTFAAELEAEAEIEIGYRQEGTLLVAVNRDEQERLRSQLTYQQAQGLDLTWLSGYEVRQKEPYLSRHVVGALYSPQDHQVDNRLLVQALKQVYLKVGGQLQEGASVQDLIVVDGQVNGLILKSQPLTEDRKADPQADPLADPQTNPQADLAVGCETVFAADTVVITTGAWAGSRSPLAKWVDLPVRPIKGQMLAVQMPADQILTEHVIWGEDVYLVPRRDGRLLIGATVEEKGFETQITVGGLLDLLKQAWTILPGLYDMPMIETWAGLRPGSPDDAPILGKTSIEGLYVATGHHRNGILLCPLTAYAMSDLIVTNAWPQVCDSFTLQRFHPDRERVAVGAGELNHRM